MNFMMYLITVNCIYTFCLYTTDVRQISDDLDNCVHNKFPKLCILFGDDHFPNLDGHKYIIYVNSESKKKCILFVFFVLLMHCADTHFKTNNINVVCVFLVNQ